MKIPVFINVTLLHHLLILNKTVLEKCHGTVLLKGAIFSWGKVWHMTCLVKSNTCVQYLVR